MIADDALSRPCINHAPHEINRCQLFRTAIDQIADERTDKPAVVKAVTLEVDTIGAQKISLAASIGTLSLMLRKAGEADAGYTRRISISDLTASAPAAVERTIAMAPPTGANGRGIVGSIAHAVGDKLGAALTWIRHPRTHKPAPPVTPSDF